MRKKAQDYPVVEVDIERLSHDGRGIAKVNNKIMFIFGALPGEKVRAKTTRCHSRYFEGIALEVLSPSVHRVRAPCDHFGICGGCQIQHLETKLQIQHKQEFLKEQLIHQAKVIPQEWLSPITGDTEGYRQKARLGVKFVEKKGSVLVGFREHNNNKIAVINKCPVLDKRIGERIEDLRLLLFSLEGKKHIAQIEVAIGSEEIALVFRHLAPLSETDLQALCHFCQSHHFSLYLQPQGAHSVHKVWPENSPLELSYTLKDQQLSFHFHPLDFTQVNQRINQQMVNCALNLLQPTPSDTLLDLFCGLGNFTLPFAQIAQKVVGVEGTALMSERARRNAQANQLYNAFFHTFDLTKDFSQEPWAQSGYSKLILDPPRSGAQEVVRQIDHLKVKEILYISCNPATFARDAAILVHQHRYRLAKVGIMDMFPHTAHVETMALFLS